MRKMHVVLMLAAALATQPIFAEDTQDMSDDSKPCAAIASACKEAGFTRAEANKKFWQDCMKPIILDQTVKGVTVDSATVKACRTSKIAKLKKMLQELEDASSK